MEQYDVIILGAGASGLMCAMTAAQRGKSVLVLEHEKKAGKKILISGGGKCNFTNTDVSAENYISENIHFCKSALSRFSQYDFLALIDKYDILFEEREHGQLFCIDSAKQILDMLLTECHLNSVKIQLEEKLLHLEKNDNKFSIKTNQNTYNCHSFVIASGGISIPKMGASDIGYKLAKQFKHQIIRTDPALVPFVLDDSLLKITKPLSGTAIDALVSCNQQSFRENILFTHQGLSGPAILQVSNYWKNGDNIEINFLPEDNLSDLIKNWQQKHPELLLKTLLQQKTSTKLTKNFIQSWLKTDEIDQKVKQLTPVQIEEIINRLQSWQVIPKKTVGYRIAEVTRGGIDTKEVSSKTFMSLKEDNLFFVGEALDVTGWLGGYNFQWAWSSGYCAGLYV